MRILYFINGLSYKGGMARIVVDKANYLSDVLGHEVTICTYNGKVESAFKLSNNLIIRTIKSGGENATIMKKLGCIAKDIRKVGKVIQEVNPDIVINAQTQVLTWIIPFVKRRVPKVMEIHFSKVGMDYNLHDKSKIFRTLYFGIAQFIYARYDRFVVLTEEDKHYWNVKNCVVIGNFTPLVSPVLSELDNKKIICVARYHEQKRLDLLVEVWRRIHSKYKGWQIDVYGMGPDKAWLQDRIDAVGVADSFKLNDAVDNVMEKYLESSIFCLTSEHEGFGLVLTEAAMIGVPICAFDIVGVKWLLSDKETALLCPFGDVDAFAQNLSMLIESRSLRVKLRTAAKKRMEDFRIEVIMEKWNSLFEGCVNRLQI